MFHRTTLQPGSSSAPQHMYTPEALRHIGTQIEALVSQHSSLEMYRRSIERQLFSIAAQIQEQDVALIPRTVFLLLEMRGSGGVSNQLEQIARILHEVGYWKPRVRVQNYYRQDVYQLGKSAQKLFDDYTKLDRRVRQLNARLGNIKQCRQLQSQTTPQAIFEALAAIPDGARIKGEVDAIINLLEKGKRRGWFKWFVMGRANKKIRQGVH